jgi:hypothetical protein
MSQRSCLKCNSIGFDCMVSISIVNTN